ncbi:MAG TPA: hypothetical protein VJA21_34405 [Verrucomicrobiae bacterium]
MSADKIISEARARIIWGEPSLAVRDFLIANGLPVAVAEAKLKEFELERSRELRRIGLRNVVIGGILAGAAGVTLSLALAIGSASSGTFKALAVVLLAGLYGLWKLLKGIVYLMRPQAEHRSIPDIAQSDLIE